MAIRKTKPTAADYAALTGDHAQERPCPRCGQPTLCARAGRVAALDVRADPDPITPLDEIHALLTGLLTWHLVPSATPGLAPRITWRDPTHIRAGPARWPVLRDHTCPPIPVQETLL
jgi:hypothetical protein